jgi:hypothetical protein
MTTTDPVERYLSLSPRQYPIVSRLDVGFDRVEGGPAPATVRLVMRAREPGQGERLVLRFTGVQGLKLAQPGWSVLVISYLSITSLRDRGMEGIAYRVHDEEEDALDFLCATFDCALEDEDEPEAPAAG